MTNLSKSTQTALARQVQKAQDRQKALTAQLEAVNKEIATLQSLLG